MSSTLEKIEANLARLKDNRGAVCERLSHVQIIKLEFEAGLKKAAGDGWINWYKEAIDSARYAHELIRDYLRELDKEIERVTKAIDDLKETDVTKLKNSFEEFVLTDTSYSAKNVAMMLYDYDRTLESMKALTEPVDPDS